MGMGRVAWGWTGGRDGEDWRGCCMTWEDGWDCTSRVLIFQLMKTIDPVIDIFVSVLEVGNDRLPECTAYVRALAGSYKWMQTLANHLNVRQGED